MKRLALFPLVFILGCEGLGSAYNTMGPALKAAIVILILLAAAAIARRAIPRTKQVFFSQTE